MKRHSDVLFSGAGYCKARKRLSVTLFEILFCQVCIAINLEIDGIGLWNGHRNWAVDGFLFCIGLF